MKCKFSLFLKYEIQVLQWIIKFPESDMKYMDLKL